MKRTSALSQLLKLSGPIILSSLLQIAYNFVDMLWVGHLGSGAVAAVGTAGFFINLGWAIASIVTVGAMVKISHSVGEQSEQSENVYVASSLIGVTAIGFIFSIVVAIFPATLIGFFQITDSSVNLMGESYLRISSLSIVITFLNLVLTAILNAKGKTKLAFMSMLYGNILNFILNPIFILLLDMGVDGAAWSTVIAKTGSLLYFVYIIIKHSHIKFHVIHFSLSHLQEVVRLGLPVAMQRILFTIIGIIIGRIITGWGTEAIAAQKLGLQVESLSFMVLGGFSQAVSIMTGHSFGAKEYLRIQKIYRAGVFLGLSLGVFTTLLFISCPSLLISIFVNDPATISIGRSYLIIVGLSQVFMCLEMITAGAYSGQGITSYPAIVSIIFTTLRIPLAIYLGYETSLGINGVWLSISITSLIKGILLTLLYRRRTARLKVISQKTS